MSKHRNYSRYSAPTTVDEIEVIGNVNDDTDTIEVTNVETLKYGVVTDCVKLNVRIKPNTDADVVCTISCLTKVIIDDTVDNFYRIHTEAGVKGFCMKKFIAIQ